MDSLNLDLKDRWKLANGAVLLSHRILDINFLDVKGTVNCCIYVPRASCNINLDVRPPLFLGPYTFFRCDVRPDASVKQTIVDKRLVSENLLPRKPNSLFYLVDLLALWRMCNRPDSTLALKKHVIDDLRHILLGTDFDFLYELLLGINLWSWSRRHRWGSAGWLRLAYRCCIGR